MTDFDTTAVPDYGQLARLTDKIFVVFGAGSGMGRQSAHALAQMGAKVVCVGRSEAATQRVADEVGGIALLGDMGIREEAEALFAKVESTYGRLDGVVNVIGTNAAIKFIDLREGDWDAQFKLGFLPSVHAIQIGGALMAKSGGGSITVVGSMAGLAATPGAVHYGVYKAALHQLTRLAGYELASSNVRVNCVVPSLTLTPKVIKILGDAGIEKMSAAIPLGRIALSSDIASAILFLSSDLANNITSQLLVVDGGSSARAG